MRLASGTSRKALKLLDANVILYALGGAHPYREPCARILEAAGTSDEYGIDTELVQEVVYVLTRRGERARALAAMDLLLATFSDPFPIARAELQTARSLMRSYDILTPRDAIHAAVVLEHGMEGLVSADRDFDPVAEIVRFDPLDL